MQNLPFQILIPTLISTLIATTVPILYFRRVYKGTMSRAMGILGSRSGVAKRDENLREDVDEAISQIVEGISMSDPRVQFAMQLIEQYTDLEINPSTIAALLEHPFVKNLLKTYGGTGTPQSEGSSSKYKFKGGIL